MSNGVRRYEWTPDEMEVSYERGEYVRHKDYDRLLVALLQVYEDYGDEYGNAGLKALITEAIDATDAS